MTGLGHFTCFEFHDSLNIETCSLIPWIQHQTQRERLSTEKWDSPGFFPHAILDRRYQKEPISFTGFVQFDIDKDTYLERFGTRMELMQTLAKLPTCHLVANSFSRHGIWGMLKMTSSASIENFEEMALGAIKPLQDELSLELDVRVSLRPEAFRLIPSGMTFLTPSS